MSTGKANFNYVQFRENFFLNQELPIDAISKNDEIEANFSHILLKPENSSQMVKYDNIRPLDNNSFNLFQKILDIHVFLLTNTELNTNLKLEYCNLERAFMKKYLNEIIQKYTSK